MTEQLKSLQDLAQLASNRNGGKRGRALQRVAEAHGLTLSYTTTDKILNGKYHSRPKRETIEALAELASVPREVAFELAGVPLPSAPLAEQLPPEVDSLNQDQRRVIVELARSFVKQNNEIYELKRQVPHEHDTHHDAPPSSEAPRAQGTEDEKTGPPAHIVELQERADNTPLDTIMGWAADDRRGEE